MLASKYLDVYDERMDPLFVFRNPEQIRAYTEAALIVCAKADTELSPGSITQELSKEAQGYVDDLSCAPDESMSDTFMEDLYIADVIKYDHPTGRYYLGKIGTNLLVSFMEEWAGNP